MRIAFLCTYPLAHNRDRVKFLYLREGSSPIWNVNLVRALAKIPGNEVHVLTHAPVLKTTTVLDEGVHVHYVAHPPKVKLWQHLTLLQLSRFTLGRELKRIQPDIVHGSGTDHEFAYAATISGYPHLVTMHMCMPELVRTMNFSRFSFASLLARFEALVLRNNKHLIAISHWISNMIPYYKGTIHHIPNAIAGHFFDRESSEEYDIAFVGKIYRLKAVRELVLAVEKLKGSRPDVTLRIIGTGLGDYAEHLKQYVIQNGLEENVTFVGQKTQEEVAVLLSKCRVVAIPSLVESFSMVAVEAQALGKPLVVTDTGALPERVEEGKTGLIVPVGDVDALAQALETILSDDKLRKSMAAEARDVALKTSHPESVARKTMEVYHQVLQESTPRENG